MVDASIDINSLMPRVTLHVDITGMKEFRVRMKLAMYCLGLAVRILGCSIEVINNEIIEE